MHGFIERTPVTVLYNPTIYIPIESLYWSSQFHRTEFDEHKTLKNRHAIAVFDRQDGGRQHYCITEEASIFRYLYERNKHTALWFLNTLFPL